jgi:Zn ribbon nucleic-acid-binding protein
MRSDRLNQYLHILPDLIVNICPLGCDGKCAEIWINETIGHKIICNCIKCGHNNNKKYQVLASVVDPLANTIQDIKSFSQGVKENDK